ncbi:hypothetical protein [Candidatus Erwinia dacicola]|uniref:Uncharacterized protein n=1 Tax=Candidatus Erwinia dacicola TaxID=252393 RepID=A0A1E7Z278_9GAMM|nr:hypothetical protein [Candidatus Erwinia dacicola]NJC99689.1 hypothetical protein [Candidatus Erwinia dacicola]OFC62872.1 hypothetical protein BBW68_07720 [Candidatus Erwinia dacicola]RAP71458.1 hypothetical protein ACZ87_01730 [Candidatus Erwinia dacicola]
MNKQEIAEFFEEAKASRTKDSFDDRLVAIEFMVCSIAAALEGSAKETSINTMNSFSENLDPLRDSTLKAVADLNVLTGDFRTLSNQLAESK